MLPLLKKTGKWLSKKGALVIFDEFAKSISQEKEITEEELLEDLKQVRKEIWNERNKKSIPGVYRNECTYFCFTFR